MMLKHRKIASLAFALWAIVYVRPGMADEDKTKEGKTEEGKPHAAQAHWDFDSAKTGAVPQGWSIRETNPSSKAMAHWQIVADPTAPSGGKAFAITRTENYGHTFNMAVAEKTAFKDLELTVKVKGAQGVEDQGGGPVWRCTDENNYYICRFNPLEANFRVYEVIKGNRHQLESANVETEAGKWYTVKVKMQGPKIQCWLDDKLLLETESDTFKDAGMIGLWSKADAVTSFDDLAVKTIAEK